MKSGKYKGLVIILDGLGDRPCSELGNLTPLEYAKTPVMDELAASNQSGLMFPMIPGLPVDTHTGVGMLFGLSPNVAAGLKRGPIEAAGIDLDLEEGDILFRANLATLERNTSGSGPEFTILDRRAQRIQEGVEELCAELQDLDLGNGVSASLFPATQHRCVLRIRGSGLSDQISDTDPGGKQIKKGVLESRPLIEDDSAALKTANAVNAFFRQSFECLESHSINLKRISGGKLPANGVIVRGPGQHLDFPNLLHYLKLNVSVIAGEATILGLGKLFGFDTITHSSFSADSATDIQGKVSSAIQELETHDLVFMHLKGTDTTAHDRKPVEKAAFIERFDQALGEVDCQNLVLGICADHSTDCISGEHNGDSVPVLIQNPSGRRDLVKAFNETSCSGGSFGTITAQGFLTLVLDAMGNLSNFKPTETEIYQIIR